MQTQAVQSTTPASNSSSPEQIRKAAGEFEAIFSSIMVKSMRGTVGENALIPSSFGDEVYTGMLDDEYSKMLGSRGALGLSGMIERELGRRGGAGQAIDEINKLKNTPPPPVSPGLQRAGAGAIGPTASLSRWSGLIAQAGKEHGVDSSLLAAVIAQESGGNPSAVSPKGAKGLMQLMDSTAADMGVRSPFSPRENIAGGAKYLRSLLDKFNGDEKLALASYNAGPGAVQKYGAIPPFAETRHYVDSVLQLKQSIEHKNARARNSLPVSTMKEQP